MTLTRRSLVGAAVPALAGLADLIAMIDAARAAKGKAGPMPDLPVSRVSAHVYMIHSPDGFPTPENRGMMCNIIFVIGDRGVAVIDSGASVQIGEMAVRQLRGVTDKPVVGIVNTHYHGDHWLGNQAYTERWGTELPRYAHPETRVAIEGAVGVSWHDAMERWTNDATAGTVIVPPSHDIDHGFEIALGGVTVRAHHYGKAHTPSDICIEVPEDGVMCVGDVMMDRRIANMEDGSYPGTFEAIDQLVANSKTSIWVPGHGEAGAAVLAWQRDLFQGIWDACNSAVKQGIPLDGALSHAMKDPRVSSKAAETKGWDRNIGKYVSLGYLEAEQAQF
jgi:glyoxylase-like metal-dependent hydrolase (beta-lactamase superfamily II)